MIVSPYSSKISVFLPPQAVQTNTQSTANTRRANFFMIGFCGGNFFWKKSLPRTPFQKTVYYISGVWGLFFGFCEGNFFGKKSPSRSLPKTFILYSKGLDSADRTQKNPTVPRSPKLYPAIAPRRRRMAPSSRSRTIYVGNRSLTLRRTRTCTNYTHPHPPHKSFAELFQKRPFPRPPVLLVPPFPASSKLRVDPAQ